MIYDKKLSIIIPYYNTKSYTDKLLDILDKQINSDIEIILVDDGSDEPYKSKYKWLRHYRFRKNSGSASKPRNKGIDVSKGENIVFIDSDDIVTNDYVQTLLDKINSEEFDYCLFSWHFKDKDIIIEDEPPFWNTSACNCIYKRELIGNERFDSTIRIGEDGDFNKRVRKGKKANITKVLYYYVTDNPNSVTYNERGW